MMVIISHTYRTNFIEGNDIVLISGMIIIQLLTYELETSTK